MSPVAIRQIRIIKVDKENQKENHDLDYLFCGTNNFLI